MAQDEVLKFFMMVFGKVFMSQMHFMDRLMQRVQLKELSSENGSDFIIAFVAVSSRAGTDIEAALRDIPQCKDGESSRFVVLVVLHHTFDRYLITPDSRLCVTRRNVFTVDCLFHEDQGLLTCQQNDEALKKVTDHLIANGGTVYSRILPNSLPEFPSRPCCTRRTCFILMCVLGLVAVCLIVGVLTYELIIKYKHN